MAILHQEYGVTIEICIRKRAANNEPPALTYGLRLLCNDHPIWNPALVEDTSEPGDRGWLWDGAPPGLTLFEAIEAVAGSGRIIRWRTRRGGILLVEVQCFGGSTGVFVGVGSALFATDAYAGGSSVGWALTLYSAELQSFAAALRREWEQLEV